MSIRLDADSVREELAEVAELDPYAYGLTPELAERITGLGDVAIHDALIDATNDRFWTIYDEVRGDAIRALARDLRAEED